MASNFSAVRFECERSWYLARLGYLFANDLLDEESAGDLIHEAQPKAGWYPLETIDLDSIIEDAGYRWSNGVEEIAPFAEQAARRVWSKWESTGDAAHAAQDWACDLIEEYATQEGITLVPGERGEASPEG